jgi:hypothetical protein
VIRGASMRRHDAANLSNIRSTLVDFTAYAAANDGRLPNPGLPQNSREDDFFYFDFGGTDRAISRYLALQREWPRVLTHWMGQSQPHWHSTFDDLTFEGTVDHSALTPEYDLHGQISSVVYSHTMFTAHTAWKMPSAVRDEAGYATHYKIVRLADIRQASAKGILANRQRPGDPHIFYAGFADGSSSLRDTRQARPRASPPLAADPNREGFPILSTLNGYTGLDY